MSEVKRYTLWMVSESGCELEPYSEESPDGLYVHHADYAALEAENENLRLSWGLLRSENNALRQQRDKLVALLRDKFPRIDPHTPVPLNEVDHCCEYVLYQERERLHKVIDARLASQVPKESA